MANKGLIGGMAAILLVAAVVGVVATMVRSRNSPSSGSNLSTTSKSVSAICESTYHQDVCQQTIGKAFNGSINSFEPNQVIQFAVNVTIDEVKVAFGNLSITSNDPKIQSAIDGCKKLVSDAMDNLYAILHLCHSLQDLQNRADDIRVWLNGVISYQTACVEDFDDPDFKAKVNATVTNIVQFASNALAIFKQYGSITKALGLDKLNITLGQSRRLLATPTNDGYPSWLTAADRRMMAATHRGLRGRAAAGGPGAVAAAAGPAPAKPNAVVAKDGSGDFASISQAVAAIPAKFPGRYVIYVKAGTYNEYVTVAKPNVYMYGDGSKKTIVTGNRNNIGGYKTSATATFVVESAGVGFIAKSMAFTNTAGPQGHQAVALRVAADMSAFFNCRMDGNQDTLYVQSNRQFYRNCVVSGTIDFIFGDSLTVLQNCLIILRRPMANQQNTVTAQGRVEPTEDTVLVIQNSRIVPDQNLFPDRLTVLSYLGRPWKNFANTVFMESEIGDVINPAGYLPWPGNNMDLCFYGEYANHGPGAVTTGRVKWKGVRLLSGPQEAQKYTAQAVLQAKGPWLQYTGERFIAGLKTSN